MFHSPMFSKCVCGLRFSNHSRNGRARRSEARDSSLYRRSGNRACFNAGNDHLHGRRHDKYQHWSTVIFHHAQQWFRLQNAPRPCANERIQDAKRQIVFRVPPFEIAPHMFQTLCRSVKEPPYHSRSPHLSSRLCKHKQFSYAALCATTRNAQAKTENTTARRSTVFPPLQSAVAGQSRQHRIPCRRALASAAPPYPPQH